jgi:hypothetical protein
MPNLQPKPNDSGGRQQIIHSTDDALQATALVDSVVSPELRVPLADKAVRTQIKRHSHFSEIDMKLFHWLRAQHMFFVATSPSAGDGTPNCSPKGLRGTFAVTGRREVAYLDAYG